MPHMSLKSQINATKSQVEMQRGVSSRNHVLLNNSGMERPTRNMKPLQESPRPDHSKDSHMSLKSQINATKSQVELQRGVSSCNHVLLNNSGSERPTRNMKPLKESPRTDHSKAALHVLEISNYHHTDHRSKCNGEFPHNQVLFNKSRTERPTRNMKPL